MNNIFYYYKRGCGQQINKKVNRFHHLTATTPTLTAKSPPPQEQEQQPKELPLPPHLTRLLSLFTSVETMATLLTTRNATLTLTKLKQGVLQLSRSDLKETHIAQFLTVLPGCYGLERHGKELVLKLPVGGVSGCGYEGRRKEFRNALEAVVKGEHEVSCCHGNIVVMCN